ncbi:MAG: BatA and WFA domain-containing protein [Armatimonadetes bacterium]|nr:BatA and WFA domain-containing protein [Armatimonadota bacterium]MDW8027971.1 BatA and WFA domain-containing protein [Armatimonadota bacterium]
MVFQFPILLWWIVPVVAFIVLLYLLKIRRRTVKVPAVFLFPKITTDVRANALWQRLRFHWLMVLQILIALLLISALARPAIKGRGFQGQTVVFVLDASASMNSKDVKPSRFVEAKRRIERWLSDLRPSDQSALIIALSEPRVAAPLSHDHQRLRRLLENLKPTDAPTDIGSALRLASALVANRPNATIVLVSDGSFAPVTDFSPGSAKLAYESVGKSDINAGFVVADAQRRGNRVRLFVGLRNFSAKPLKGMLSLIVDGKLSAAKETTLQPKQIVGETVLVPATVRQVTVKWECPEDFLPSDDEINFVGIGRQPARVLLVSSGNFFLERALALEPDCIVDKSPQVPETEKGSGTSGRYDIVIFDGTKFEPVKAKTVWLIGVADGEFVRKVGTDKQPTIVAWEREHPVLRFVDLSAVLIDKGLKVEVASWAKNIAEAKETPLFVVGERGNKRWLFVGFNFLDSDFPLRVGFPIFIANALRWSVGGQRWEQGFVVKAGSVVTLTVPSQQVSIRHPDGRSENVNAPENLLTLRATEKIGVYEIRSGNLRTQFAVNLLNADESDIAPKQTVTLGAHTVAAQTAKVAWRDLWWLFVLLALIVLAIEWAVFVRWS